MWAGQQWQSVPVALSLCCTRDPQLKLHSRDALLLRGILLFHRLFVCFGHTIT